MQRFNGSIFIPKLQRVKKGYPRQFSDNALD